MAADGAITADIVKAAMFAAADETNEKFASMPKTFSQIWTSFQNTALMAFQPVLNRLNEIANSDAFQQFVNNAIEGLSVVAGIALEIFDLLVSVAGAAADNWSWLSPIIYGVAAALAVYYGWQLAVNMINAKMAKQVKEKVPNAHFIIVGNGDQESDIRKYAADNGFSDSLHITGWVDNPMSYVELFDVACLLSRWEGFGLALPEYMMAGKPIVASRVDAIPNIIKDGENGLLVEVDDAAGASKAVLRIYKEKDLKEKIIAQGLEDVHNRFNARRVSEEHSKLFDKEMD